MPAIWRNDSAAWSLLAPSRYPDEAALHKLVEDAPHVLPLAGSPGLVVVGREVQLGAVGQGNTTRAITDDLLVALTTAYEEAARGIAVPQIT